MHDPNELETLLERRGALWLALSPLWLEREPREREYLRMLEVVETQGHTPQELEMIYRLEMAPVMSRRQMSVAGEWRAFDEDRLLLDLARHTRRLHGWRKGFWLLFSGLTTMMSRPRFDILIERLHATSP
ncbi:hypothetical protein ACFO0E_13250 [Chromohalobacter beijerinckii]|uniref:DUF7079 domain-containing protein n=1 Tax=Chromohalobacter beijerinckii TaxID=86179 RepID=A0ABV8XEP7_9GAMM|nr:MULTISPECIES: hypothetical protein [Chromohalobacter]MCK0764856.1 hypothetical protein [Chromohalobacter beijerinckii]